MDDSGEKRKFFLEPEKRTTVVHTDECQEYITKSITGEPPSGWLGPFSTYESAFEYGSNLENKSYPKTCRKCTPWKHAHALEYFMKQAINRMKEYPVLFALGVLLSISSKLDNDIGVWKRFNN